MDEIVQACAKHGVQFMDGGMWPHNPRTKYIKEYLTNKELLGELKNVVSPTSPGTAHQALGWSDMQQPV